jgi:hypothetical protein
MKADIVLLDEKAARRVSESLASWVSLERLPLGVWSI